VPVTYPNTGYASDTTKGSKTVKITKKEIMLKNKSYFKTSVGDEAGCAAKKGVITSVNKGKVYFQAWSMDVKVEGENVDRHLDLTTNNHASFPGDTPPWIFKDTPAGTAIKDCENEVDNANTACEEKGITTKEDRCADNDDAKACRDAKRCLLVTYNQGKRKSKKSQVACCEGEQPHHLVEAHCFYERGKRGKASHRTVKAPQGKRAYRDKDSPCVCAKGPRDTKEHGQYHAFQQKLEAAHHKKNKKWTYKDASDAGAKSNKAVNPQCSEECTKAQLDAYHKDRCGMEDETELRTDPEAGTRSSGSLTSKQKTMLKKAVKAILGIG